MSNFTFDKKEDKVMTREHKRGKFSKEAKEEFVDGVLEGVMERMLFGIVRGIIKLMS